MRHLINKATTEDRSLLVDIAQKTFIESHGLSAKKPDIDFYVKEKCSVTFFEEELKDPANIYHIVYHQGEVAGYSKIILNCVHSNIQMKNITKLERLYLLKDSYSLNIGRELLNFNIQLSKKNNQAGIWLFVWKENHRALHFYLKNDFKIIGSFDFKISPNHSNPNHQMLLDYA